MRSEIPVTRHRSLFTLLAISASLALIAPAQAADKYPVRPIRMIVPYPPGGGSDLTGRAIAQKLTDSLGQTVVVDNRPGATGLIGTELAAKAPADGHTIILADAPHTINALVYTKQRYDAIRDFEPINLVATSPQGLFAHPSFRLNTLKELLALPRAQTEKLAMGSSGLASGPHMIYEALRLKTGLTLNHIPYKGGGPSLADGASGQIPLVMNAVPAAMPFVKAGRLKVLAITAAKRHPQLPDVQTFQEAGVKDFVTFQWYGVLAPARTPKDIVARLNADINKAITAPDVKDRFTALTFDVTPGSPNDFLRLLQDEDRRWKEVLKQVRVSLD
jgi:tripartite-type tricarboxylate transporter receptor subunit TctC